MHVQPPDGGLTSKIGLATTWAKLDGYCYEQALSRYFPTVMYVD